MRNLGIMLSLEEADDLLELSRYALDSGYQGSLFAQETVEKLGRTTWLAQRAVAVQSHGETGESSSGYVVAKRD